MEKRIPILDLIRTIAIILICLNHATSVFYVDQISYATYNGLSLYSKLFMTTFYILSRLGVPLFLFLTGALLLNKKFDNFDDIKKFYKHNLLSLIISVELWNFIYYFINLGLNNINFNIVDLIKILLFINNSIYGHMWYMPMIIGMYIFIPYLSIIVKKFSIKQLSLPLIVLIFYYFIINTINGILIMLKCPFNLNSIIPMNFFGAQYGVYILLGYYIYNANLNNKFKNINKTCLLLISIIFFLFSCIYQIFLYDNSMRQIVYYNSFLILIYSTSMYIYILNIKINDNKFINYISKNSLAIYFIHFPILMIMQKYITINLTKPIMVILFLIISILISTLILTILKKFKYTKKYLLRQ